MKRPILIIAYKRYSNVINLLKTINPEDVSIIYIALDGLRHQDSGERQAFLDEILSISIKADLKFNIWKRGANLGPAVSVITAIDWFFSFEDSGIILEDDLVIEAKTIEYFDKSLSFYENERSVYIVSGSQYWDLSSLHISNPWSTYPITWGWATWGNRWREMRSVYFEKSIEFQQNTGLSERFFWKVGLYRCISGIQDAWDIPMAIYIHSVKGICLLPNENLVTNIGADEFAGNTHLAKWPLMTPIKESKTGLLLIPPSDLTNANCLDALIRSEIYGISIKNLFTGVFFFIVDWPRSLRRDRLIKLPRRIQMVRLPDR